MTSMLINNRYQMVKKLGEGGMGYVLLVEDILLAQKRFALKAIKQNLLNQTNLHHFRNEFELMTRLKHPNLMRVFDFGYDDLNDIFFIVMEYVPGISLKDYLLEMTVFSTEKAIDILVTLSRTFDFIHSRNILHRDIKPANIMLMPDKPSPDFSLKVMDFGLAGLSSHEAKRSIGTLLYLAPEILRHHSMPASDIFAAGMSFIEMLTGDTFYETAVTSALIKILSNEHTFRTQKFRALQKIEDESLREIVSKMIAYQSNDRHQSFSEVIWDINRRLLRSYPLEISRNHEAYVLGGGFIGRVTEMLNFKKIIKDPDRSPRLHLFSASNGYGKTRLFQEFKKYCLLNDVICFEGSFLPQFSRTYGAFLDIANEILLHSPSEILARVGPELKKILPSHPHLKTIEPHQAYEPKMERGSIIEAITDCFISFSEQVSVPVVILLDDLGDADEVSLELIQNILFKLTQFDHRNLFLFASIKPEEQTRISGIIDELSTKDRLESFFLLPFSSEEVNEYIANVLGKKNISRALSAALPQICDTVGGNPLYLQEVLKKLLNEEYIIRNKEGWILAKPLKQFSRKDLEKNISVTLQELALTEPEFETLKFFTLVNRSMSLSDFQQIVPEQHAPDLPSLFERLAESEILTKNEVEGTIKWTFSQAHFITTLEKKISSDQKKKFHGLIGHSLIETRQDRIDEFVDEIAYHLYRSDDEKSAVEYLIKAAAKAKSDYANEKAIHYYSLLDELVTDIDLKVELKLKKGELLHIVGRWQEALTVLRQGLSLAQETKNQALICQCILEVGDVHRMMGEFSEATASFEEAHVMLTALGDRQGIQNVLQRKGVLLYNLGQYSQAMDCYEQCLKLAEEAEDKQALGQVTGNMGLVHWHLGEYEKAMECYERQLKIVEELNNISDILVVNGNRGILYLERKNYDKARQCFQICAKIVEKSGDKRFLSHIVGNMGILYHNTGNYTRAMECYQRQLVIVEELNDKNGINQAVGNIGTLHTEQGAYELAKECLVRKMSIVEEQGDKKRISTAACSLGTLHFRLKDFVQAEKYYDLAIQIGEELNIKYYLCYYYFYKAELLYTLERLTECQSLLIKSREIARVLDKEDMLFNTSILQIKAHFQETRDDPESPSSAVKELVMMLLDTRSIENKATINYELHEITGEPKYARSAYQYYQKLYKKTPNITFKERIEKLKQIPGPALLEPEVDELIGLNTEGEESSLLANQIQAHYKPGLSDESRPESGQRLLSDYVYALSSQEHLSEVLETTMNFIFQVSDAFCGLIVLLDEVGGVKKRIYRGEEDSFLNSHTDFNVVALEELRKVREPLFFSGQEYLTLLDSFKTKGHLNGFMGILPLLKRNGQDVAGALFFEGAGECPLLRHFSAGMIRELTREAAYSVANALTYEKIQRERKDWARLSEIGNAISSILDLDQLLNIIVDAVIEITGSERGFLMLKNHFGRLDFRIARDVQKQNLDENDFDISFSMAREVVRTAQPILKADIEDDDSFIPTESIVKLQLKSILCVPLKIGIRILGVIYVDNSIAKSNFTAYDLNLLSALSAQAAIAIENAVLYENLQYAHRELLKLDEMKTKFLSLASHELRTPLTVITGYLDFLEKQRNIAPKHREINRVMKQKVHKLNSIVNSILSLAKLSTPEYPLKLENISLRDLLSEIEKDMKPFIESREQTLMISQPEEVLYVFIDYALIWQTLANLVLNAIQFTKDGGCISVEVSAQKMAVEIRVSDTGIGIPESEYENIFTSFYEIEDISRHSSGETGFKAGGLGVGLTIARYAVELHGGKIWVESEVGKGSSFNITLPTLLSSSKEPG
ncbi:tetratricopeptide repeat protein [candidate division CSSED10-310 bacterium]|uniref:histidine kinase n=1 Tax=candidate division CSSED10-310 bacterium TaxID=2855610 RepID=A0ABV6Z3S5_UNCC1